eukprot:g16921.t1
MPFKSKMKRMAASTPGSTIFTESTIAKNPGPGTYHPKELGSEPALEMQPAVKPILKDQEKTTPSMPPMRYLPGQVPMTEAAAADLSKLSSRHTGEPGDMAGPGTYELQSRLIKDSPVPVFRKPPGRHFRKLWEASAAIESKMPPKDLPGPGAYEPEVKDSAKGAASQFNSKVPKIPKDSSKTPGPGAYDERCEAMSLSLGFGSLTERVGWPGTPGFIRGTNGMLSQAEQGMKLFESQMGTAAEYDKQAAEQYKVQVELKIADLDSQAAMLTGKDNKKERAAKGKEVAELKSEQRRLAATSAKETAGLSPAETKELENLKQQIIERKALLKELQGLSGESQEVVKMVARMNELKEKQDPGSTKKEKEGKKDKKTPLSAEELKEFGQLQGEIEIYKAKLRTESRDVKHPYADPYNVVHVPGPGHYTDGASVKDVWRRFVDGPIMGRLTTPRKATSVSL